ncbi:MAG: ABC transporter permease [Anaerolineales bacterium]|nr:ABC transporter permease [Anaerolineales bacterium]
MKNILEYLRVVGVLARKDIVQGIKNRNILVLFFSVAFLILFYKALPSLSAGKNPISVFIYDAGNSAYTGRLEEASGLEVRSDFPSEEEMKRRLALGDRPELGLVIPAGFDDIAAGGDAPPLRGIVAYWLSGEEVAGLKAEVEEAIAAVWGTGVSIAIDKSVVYGPVDDEGAGTQAAMALIFSLTMIGISLVPHLMFDEKQARTLDVLLVSPASATQIAAGKLLAGLFYSGTVAALAVIVNHSLIVHWGLFLVILAVYAIFCVSMGLILGTAMESRAQFAVWAWLIILPLFMPVILYLLRELIPDAVMRVLPVIPSVTAYLAMRYVFAQPITLGAPLLGLGWVIVCTGIELAVVSWLLRRRDRADESKLRKKNGVPPAQVQPEEAFRPPARTTPQEDSGTKNDAPESSCGRAALRITAAIALKDVREAFRNRLIFSVMIGTAFLAVNGSLLPALINRGSPPSAVVFDEGKSAAFREAVGEIDGRLVAAASREDMEMRVVEATGIWIGFVLPADFDALVQSRAEIRLEAYAAHWADPEKTAQDAVHFSEQLSLAASTDVKITMAEEGLYPSADSSGRPLINLLTQILMLAVVGFAIVPLLFVEEKESRTMDILRVSPAGYVQILVGKLLAGMTYGLFVGIVIALMNLKQIVHWDVLALTLFLGALFVVSVGTLVGVLADSPTAAAFWGSPLFILVVLPLLFETFLVGVWPAWLTDLLSWFPTSVIMRMFRLAIAGEAPAQMVWQSAAVLAAVSAVFYALAGWIMRRKHGV